MLRPCLFYHVYICIHVAVARRDITRVPGIILHEKQLVVLPLLLFSLFYLLCFFFNINLFNTLSQFYVALRYSLLLNIIFFR